MKCIISFIFPQHNIYVCHLTWKTIIKIEILFTKCKEFFFNFITNITTMYSDQYITC